MRPCNSASNNAAIVLSEGRFTRMGLVCHSSEVNGIVPINACQLYQRAIKGATAVVLEHCGHMPEMEQPEAFVKGVLDFLQA